MNAVSIDFNDAIYQETGISKSAVAMREEVVKNADGHAYTLQVVKKNLGDQDTLYICLKNRAGLPVQDIKVRMGDRILEIDRLKSQDSAVIERVHAENLEPMEIVSESENVRSLIRIGLEKPRELPARKQIRRKSEESERESEKMNR